MKLKNLVVSFALIGSLFCVGPVQAFAASSSEIEEQIRGYMADLEASQQKSEELEEEISSKQEEVGELYSEVVSLNIEKDEYFEEMKKRITYFYEDMQGQSILGTLLTSKNFAEFISRLQFQQSLYDYDSARLEEYQGLVDDLEDKQTVLDAEIEDLGDMVEEQVVLQATLDATIASKQTEYDEAKAAEEAAAAAAKAAAEAAAREAEKRAQQDAVVYAMSVEDTSETETESVTETVVEEKKSEPETTEAAETTETTETKPASTSSSSGSSSGVLTKSKGINYFNGHMETWYSERILPGTGLNIPGRYTDSSGLVRDGDGYICVASDDYPYGTIIETSLGTGKVYDCGPGSGIVDIYTNW